MTTKRVEHYLKTEILPPGDPPWTEQQIADALRECARRGFSAEGCRKGIQSAQQDATATKGTRVKTTNMTTATEARAEAVQRAKHYMTNTRERDFKAALGKVYEDDPALKALAGGVGPAARKHSDHELAGAAFAKAVRMFQRDHGLTHREATLAAKLAEGNTLRSLRSGFAPRPKTTESQRIFSRLFRP